MLKEAQEKIMNTRSIWSLELIRNLARDHHADHNHGVVNARILQSCGFSQEEIKKYFPLLARIAKPGRQTDLRNTAHLFESNQHRKQWCAEMYRKKVLDLNDRGLLFKPLKASTITLGVYHTEQLEREIEYFKKCRKWMHASQLQMILEIGSTSNGITTCPIHNHPKHSMKGKGRSYAMTPDLSWLKKKTREIITYTGDTLHTLDIDMKNALPTIALNCLNSTYKEEKESNRYKCVQEYVSTPDQIRNRFAGRGDVPTGLVKVAILSALFGGRQYSDERYQEYSAENRRKLKQLYTTDKDFNSLLDGMEAMGKALVPQARQWARESDLDLVDWRNNQAVAFYLQEIENQQLKKAIEQATDQGWTPGQMMYDGCYLYADTEITSMPTINLDYGLKMKMVEMSNHGLQPAEEKKENAIVPEWLQGMGVEPMIFNDDDELEIPEMVITGESVDYFLNEMNGV